MLDECAEVNAVESFRWIVEDGVIDVINGGGKLVASDGQYELVCCPCLHPAMLVARSFSRAWTVAPADMIEYVGGSFAGMMNAALLQVR
jgi:hypothetical protein